MEHVGHLTLDVALPESVTSAVNGILEPVPVKTDFLPNTHGEAQGT